MAIDANLEKVKEMLAPLLTDDLFLVDARVKPTNNLRIYLDADGGLPIEKCIKINRALYKQIEEAGMYEDGNFSLEVSSPGVDEPLKLHRQFVKNIGRTLEVTKNDESKQEGKLIAVNENELTLEVSEGKGKKKENKQISIAFADMKQAVVMVTF